jgi:hypothetical protein
MGWNFVTAKSSTSAWERPEREAAWATRSRIALTLSATNE